MALTHSTDMLDPTDRQTLLQLAAEAIQYGLTYNDTLPVDSSRYSARLQQAGASFVTLKISGELRGCIGSLQASRALAEDVADNAYAAAFRDPRFAPLSAVEYGRLHYHISILSPSQAMRFASEEDLLQQLRPGIDGLVLSDAGHRGTFLPSVWESLPEPRDFLRHLKMKAGLPGNYWSDTLKIERYGAEGITGAGYDEVPSG